ncbi:MAG: hypothetical protein IJU92_10040 [Spirochaetaceae bacterium]|nr:hypothetical protein [Spirochaetaceae bacterium]
MKLEELKAAVHKAELDSDMIVSTLVMGTAFSFSDLGDSLRQLELRRQELDKMPDTYETTTSWCFLSISITRDLLGHCGSSCTRNCPVSCTTGPSKL